MNLEQQSFVNLVNFYREELLRVYRGERVTHVIPESTSRKPLYKYSVLRHVKPMSVEGRVGGSKVTLTEEAKRVLGVD